MTLENILVVSQWVGLYADNTGNPDDEYFEYIKGNRYLQFIVFNLTQIARYPLL